MHELKFTWLWLTCKNTVNTQEKHWWWLRLLNTPFLSTTQSGFQFTLEKIVILPLRVITSFVFRVLPGDYPAACTDVSEKHSAIIFGVDVWVHWVGNKKQATSKNADDEDGQVLWNVANRRCIPEERLCLEQHFYRIKRQ